MRSWLVALLSALAGLALPAGAAAEGSIESHEGREPAPLVLRPVAELRPLAHATAHVLHRRTGRSIEVGEPPPGGLAEAVPAGQLALVRVDGGVELLLVRSGASAQRAIVAVRKPTGQAAARAAALAIEGLLDELPRTEIRPRSVPRPGRLPLPPPPPPSERETAKPTIFLRLMLGISPVHAEPIVGPGAGLGLCGGPHCVVLEGDVSVLPIERSGQDGQRVRYRSFNGSLRGQIRPWIIEEDFLIGLTLGLLTRTGRAELLDTGNRQVVTNFGARGTLELTWRIAAPLELLLELGVDLAVTRARFTEYGAEPIYLEDRWTPWLVGGLRMRP